MKKFFLLVITGVMLMAFKANAQTITINYTQPGYGNQDTFTYYVTCEGYLHYSLIDNGPGGDNYEDYFELNSENGPVTFLPIGISNPGGGNIVGCVYIGTTDQEIWISHGCGFITGDDSYSGESYDINVTF